MSYAQIPSDVQFGINGGAFPPHGVITVDSQGAYAVVTTWIFACISILAVLVRVTTRLNSRGLGKDSLLIFLALVRPSRPHGFIAAEAL